MLAANIGWPTADEILLEPHNGKTKKTLGDRAFAVVAPRLFNSLPREIRHKTCFNTFKTKVKTFLFRTAFYIFLYIYIQTIQTILRTSRRHDSRRNHKAVNETQSNNTRALLNEQQMNKKVLL